MNPHMTIATFAQRGQIGQQRTWIKYNNNNKNDTEYRKDNFKLSAPSLPPSLDSTAKR